MIVTRATRRTGWGTVMCSVAIAATLLTGCTASDPFASLPEVELPVAAAHPSGSTTPEFTRLIGDDDSGHNYYVTRWETETGSQICLVMIAADRDYVSGCVAELPVTVEFDGTTATLYATPPPTMDSDDLIEGVLEITD